jgi:carbon-monoxide dehydrogenase medium subunit
MRFRNYIRAGSVEECLSLMQRCENAVLLAGGTDLVPRITDGRIRPETVIDVSRISELCGVRRTGGGLTIGAMTRLSALQKDESLTGAYGALRDGAGHVASIQIRNMATLGGNCCNASPAADTLPAMLLLDARVVLESPEGKRSMPVEEFLLGPGKTALRKAEMLTGFVIPPEDGSAAVYRKYTIRGDSDLAIVGAGALIRLDESGRIDRAGVALSAAGPTAMRMKKAEALLLGQRPCAELFAEAAAQCAGDCEPVSDQRASAWYRRKMAAVQVRRALAIAAGI